MRCGSPDRARPAPAARAASVWLTSAALLLGACGGGSTGDADDADPGQTSRAEAPAETEGTAVDETAATAEAEAPGDGEPESLSDYLGFDLEDPDAAAAQFQESERRAQELMALCMGREGFEYVPFTSTAGLQADFQDDSEEYAREYGFGITTWYGREEPDDGGSETDPNQAIQAAMSESEREAYSVALYGPPTTDEEGVEAFEGELTFGGGCQGEAYQEVLGQMMRLMQTLGPAIQDMNERMQADQRVAEAAESWSACMADRGYRYEDQNEMFASISTDFGGRLDEIIGPDGGAVDPFEGWTEEQVATFLAENSQEEIDDFYEQAQSEARAAVDQEAVAALQQEERDLAAANFECGRDLQDVLEEVWPEYEQGFISENREQLEEVRDG